MGACCAKPVPDVVEGTVVTKVNVPVPEDKLKLVNEFYQKLINHGGDAEW